MTEDILSKEQLESLRDSILSEHSTFFAAEHDETYQALTTALHYLKERDEAWKAIDHQHEKFQAEVERLREALEGLRTDAENDREWYRSKVRVVKDPRLTHSAAEWLTRRVNDILKGGGE